jgi:hypothetical protein
MSDVVDALPVNQETESADQSPVCCWGIASIGHVIHRTERQTQELLLRGRIQSARKIGGRWFASTRALREEFGL